MDNPVGEIQDVILQLTTGAPSRQKATLEEYFTKDASFKHPFCTVTKSRNQILSIFQWYKILSPHVQIAVNSVAYDQAKNILYVNISQTFKIWFIPFYEANVNLTTVLQLVHGQVFGYPFKQSNKLYISSQNDLYQVDQFVKFFLPFGVGIQIVLLWHWMATLCCVLGATVFGPLYRGLMDGSTTKGKQPSVIRLWIPLKGEASGLTAEERRDSKKPEQPLQERANGSDAKVGEMERMSNLGEAYKDGTQASPEVSPFSHGKPRVWK